MVSPGGGVRRVWKRMCRCQLGAEEKTEVKGECGGEDGGDRRVWRRRWR